jgi:hypothetical protein
VTIASRPSYRDGTAGDVLLICVGGEAEYFFKWDWTGQISLNCFDKLRFRRKAPGQDFGGYSDKPEPSPLRPRRKPNVLDDHKQVPCIDRRRRKAKVPVERNSPIVFGMNGERTHADHIRDLERTSKRIQQETRTNAAALCVRVDRKARKYQ